LKTTTLRQLRTNRKLVILMFRLNLNICKPPGYLQTIRLAYINEVVLHFFFCYFKDGKTGLVTISQLFNDGSS